MIWMANCIPLGAPPQLGRKRLYMHSIAWWPTLIVLAVATFTDLRSRRIPNWLVLPFMLAGIGVSGWLHGWSGIGQSLSGLGLGALLLGGGFRRAQMLWLVAAVESATILGGLVGWYFLRNVSYFWLALALSNAAGGFFYLALHAVLGEILKHHKALVLANFAAGFVAVAALILYFHLRA